MARARSICNVHRCPEFTVAGGRCQDHQPDHGWGTSNRRKPKGWAKTRRYVIKRDGRRCRVCGSFAQLEVDHIVCQALGGTERTSNLQTLCHRCHEAKTLDEARTIKAAIRMSKADKAEAIEGLIYRWT